MSWWVILILIVGGLLALMFLRVPVAFAFLFINIIAAFFLWGGEKGLEQLIKTIDDSLSNFSLAPIIFFILMGEIMFQTGIAPRLIETLNKWVGKVPARLSILSIGGGTLLSTITGSSMASTAMLGSTLIPEMEKNNYKTQMSVGPVLASGTLAALIPPSGLAVLLASMGKISVGAFLIAIVIPGILLACFFALYVIVRVKLQPDLAPHYDQMKISFAEKVKGALIYILPLGIIIFFVIGLIFLGVATPTEAAATGAFASLLLAMFYKQLNWQTIKKSILETMKVSAMMLLIVGGSGAFSQILAFSGASTNLVRFITQLDIPAIAVLLLMILLVIIMGTFMESISILMITLPIFMPIAHTLGFDLLWFATILLIAVELGTISPPFGVGLFVMKAVAPKGITMGQIYGSVIPFLVINILLIIIILLVPGIVTFLPSLMLGS